MNKVPATIEKLNLDDSLHLLFPAESIEWLNKKPDQYINFKWISLHPEQLEKGDLLLLKATNIRTKTIKSAISAGAVAILILGPHKINIQISEEIPIINITNYEDIRDVQREFIKLLTNKNATLNERKLQIQNQLTKLAAEGEMLDGIARAMVDIASHGILIHDKRLNILSSVPSPDLREAWTDIALLFSQQENLPARLQDRQQAGETNFEILQDITGGLSRIIVPIIVGNVARGYLSVIGMEGTLDTLDTLVAEEGSRTCAIIMSRTKAVRETEKKLQSDLLSALLQDDLSPRDASLWVEAIGLDQSQAHAALQFVWDSATPPSRRRLETLISGAVIELDAKVILHPAGESVVCFCQNPIEDNKASLAVKLGKKVIELAQIEYTDIKVRCGIGSPVKDINKWHISFKEAGLALEMATKLKEQKPYYYPDLSVYRLLLLLENNPELNYFIKDVLGSLLTEHKKDNLIETLEAYFKNNANLSKTAKALFIHRNTLAYRINKIKTITGMDLYNPETALAVNLALKIYRISPNID